MLSERQIQIDGVSWSVCGPEDCHYFANLPDSFKEFSDLRRLLGRNEIVPAQVIDVGANIGLFTLWASQAFPDAKLVAVEPNPSVYEALAVNTGTLGDRTSTIQKAVGERPGSELFRPGGPINPARTAGAHFVSEAETSSASDVSVSLMTLDSIAGPSGDTLVKIDVEGFELEVLRGGADLISRPTTLVFMEFNAWCLIGLRRMNPHDLLDHVMNVFTFVYVVRPGEPLRLIKSKEDILSFLHDHLINHGCVDDLLLSHSRMA